MKRVLVMGGGIGGSSAAYALALAGAEVTLVDAAHTGQATAAGAGIISYGGLRSSEDWYHFFLTATRAHERFVQLLENDGEGELGYGVVGELVIAPDDPSEERLGKIASELEARRRESGNERIGDVAVLAPDEARALFPPLRPGLAAVHVSGVARLDGRAFRDALRRVLECRGVRVLAGTARLRPTNSGAPVVEIDGETLTADSVIVSAGAWTQEALAPLGIALPVEPQRGQIAHLGLEGVETGSFPVLSGYERDYTVCFPPDRVVVGATREERSGFDYRLTAAGVSQVLSRALAVAPGLAEATLREVRIGFRPATPDGLPILGRLVEHEGLYCTTGFGPSGLTLAPYCGALVAAEALGDGEILALVGAASSKPLSEVLRPFSASRFDRSSTY